MDQGVRLVTIGASSVALVALLAAIARLLAYLIHKVKIEILKSKRMKLSDDPYIDL